MMCLLMPFTFRKRPPNTPPCSSLLDSLNEAVLIVNDNSEILFATVAGSI